MLRQGIALRTALRLVLPLLFFMGFMWLWDFYVSTFKVPVYVLPSPRLIWRTLMMDWPLLSASLYVTLYTTFVALFFAIVGGVLLACLFSFSKIVEYSLYPFAIILQVTPLIAIAPLLLIYLSQETAVLMCAWIVAFFPILTNMMLGFKSVDRNLVDLFRLYCVCAPNLYGRFVFGCKLFWYLRWPSALPYFFSSLKIAGGLALIGAVVAEIAAGSVGAGSGLAYRIMESQFRLNIPRLFAALLLLSLAGIFIFSFFSFVSHVFLRRWHESAKPTY